MPIGERERELYKVIDETGPIYYNDLVNIVDMDEDEFRKSIGLLVSYNYVGSTMEGKYRIRSDLE